LIPDKSPGRPRQIDEDGEALLSRVMGKNPKKLGYGFTRWTVANLGQHLYAHLHIQVHPETVRRAVKRLGYRYKRPKLSLKHKQDPHEVRRARREREAALKKSPGIPTATPSPSATNVSAISIPA
jgi:transposase